MLKSSLLAAAAVLVVASGATAAGKQPAPTSANAHVKATSVAHLPVNRGLDVLYDQTSNDSGIGIVSQNFESSFDAYDAAAADDFTVPDGVRWVLREIDVPGVYFNGGGPLNSVNVTIYYHLKGNKNLPGPLVKKEYDNVVPTSDNAGSLVITLPHKVKLGAKKYWLSIQANMDFSAGGEWAWENQSTSEDSPAVWENPGDGFATGCTTWTQENVCIPDGQGDHMFTLRGQSFSVEQ